LVRYCGSICTAAFAVPVVVVTVVWATDAVAINDAIAEIRISFFVLALLAATCGCVTKPHSRG
jgi:hypothetical protein